MAAQYFLCLPSSRLYWHHAFVSYRGHDLDAARALTHSLQDLGLRAWWDRDAGTHDQAPRLQPDVRGPAPIPGDDEAVHSQLAVAIADSILVAVVTSDRTRESLWVRKEIDVARDLQTPLFFWHVVDPDASDTISIRRGGALPGDEVGEAFMEEVALRSEEAHVASPDSVAFMLELGAQEGLNVVGHLVESLAAVGRVARELNQLIECAELVIARGGLVTHEAVREVWPEYFRLLQEAHELRVEIAARFGRQVNAGRVLVTEAFRVKRPFAVSRVRHLQRLLDDEAFRDAQL